jgi:hypothetical protein
MDNDQIAAIKNAQKESKKDDKEKDKAVEKINLSKVNRKREKIGRHFYIYEDLDNWLNMAARKSGNTKSELVEIAVKMLREHSEF